MLKFIKYLLNFSRSIKLRFLSEFISKISNFLIVPIITYNIGIKEYGSYVVILSVINGILPILSLGLNFTVIKKLSSLKNINTITNRILTSLTLVCILYLILFVFVFLILSNFFTQYLLISILTLSTAFAISCQTIFLETLRSKYLSDSFCYLLIIDSITFLGSIFILSKYFFLSIELILSILIILKIIITSITFFFLVKKKVVSVSFSRKKQNYLKYYIGPGIIYILLGLSEWLINFSDKLIIGFYLDSLWLSFYFTIALISSSILSLGSIFWWDLLPKLNEFKNLNNYGKIFSLIKNKNEDFMSLCSTLIISLTILSPLIQQLLLDQSIDINNLFYLIFFIAIFIHQISTGWEFFCYIENKGSFILKNAIFWGIISFLLYFILIPIFNVYGALFTLFLTKLCYSITLKKYAYKIGFKGKILKRKFSSYIIPFLISLFIFLILDFSKFFQLGIYINSLIYLITTVTIFIYLDDLFKKYRA